LDIVNVSIKTYFRLNTLRLCKNLIRTVESRQFSPFHTFPAAQRVTYKFYVGRLAVFDERYVRGRKSPGNRLCCLYAAELQVVHWMPTVTMSMSALVSLTPLLPW
jgi:hypothetical protein